MSELDALHFLRPGWLAGVFLAALIGLLLGGRQGAERQWRGRIAPHLLAHLVVRPRRRLLPGPRAWLVTLLALASVALAGPSWQREAPAFAEDRGALVIVLDLGASMNGSDIAPTRLIRAKQKIGELLALRKNARTGLVVFANSAHRVMPLSEDPAVLRIYLEPLGSALMPAVPAAPNRLADALAQARAMLDREGAVGSVLVVSDGTALGAPAIDAHNVTLWRFGRDASAGPGLEQIAATLDDSDVKAVHQRIEQDLSNAAENDASRRWQDGGIWLLGPLLLLAALGFRRGWSVCW